jgi:hypothetical protein
MAWTVQNTGSWGIATSDNPPVCEVIVYPSALSAGSIATLRGYAQAKWGTP